MPCFECFGSGCDFCNGTGRIEMHECVNRACSTESAVTDELWTQLAVFENFQILPEAGGWNDQPQDFKESVYLMSSIKSYQSKKQQERAMKWKSRNG